MHDLSEITSLTALTTDLLEKVLIELKEIKLLLQNKNLENNKCLEKVIKPTIIYCSELVKNVDDEIDYYYYAITKLPDRLDPIESKGFFITPRDKIKNKTITDSMILVNLVRGAQIMSLSSFGIDLILDNKYIEDKYKHKTSLELDSKDKLEYLFGVFDQLNVNVVYNHNNDLYLNLVKDKLNQEKLILEKTRKKEK